MQGARKVEPRHRKARVTIPVISVVSRKKTIPPLLCMSRHEEALEHARSAVFYGQEREEFGTQRGGSGGGDERLGGAVSRRARLATLAISYYNLAVELEYTRRYQACLRW